MTIRSIQFQSLVTDGVVQRKDHVLFPITSTNEWGIGGWSCNLISEIVDEWDIWSDLSTVAKRDVGQIITREDNYITYHALVIADPNKGYDKTTYVLLEKAMADLAEKIEDEIVRPVKSVMFAPGTLRLPESDNPGRVRRLLSLQVNNSLEFDLYSETT